MAETLSLLEYLYSLNHSKMAGMPPVENKIFETLSGSWARRTNRPDSDIDVVGVFVPTFEELYPAWVPGFGKRQSRPKVVQIPDLSVALKGRGLCKVDVVSIDIVHLFNLLVSGSPNHVELLFFEDDMHYETLAGHYLLGMKDMFLTGRFVDKLLSASYAIRSSKIATRKKYMLSARFSAYIIHLFKFATIKPERLRNVCLREMDCDSDVYAQKIAITYGEYAEEMAPEVKKMLPQEVDERQANDLLSKIMQVHWDDLSSRLG